MEKLTSTQKKAPPPAFLLRHGTLAGSCSLGHVGSCHRATGGEPHECRRDTSGRAPPRVALHVRVSYRVLPGVAPQCRWGGKMAGRSARRDITAKGRRHASSWAIEWPDTSRSELDGGLRAGMRSRLEPSPRLQCHAPTCDHAVCIPSAREHCCVVAVATHDNAGAPISP